MVEPYKSLAKKEKQVKIILNRVNNTDRGGKWWAYKRLFNYYKKGGSALTFDEFGVGRLPTLRDYIEVPKQTARDITEEMQKCEFITVADGEDIAYLNINFIKKCIEKEQEKYKWLLIILDEAKLG